MLKLQKGFQNLNEVVYTYMYTFYHINLHFMFEIDFVG